MQFIQLVAKQFLYGVTQIHSEFSIKQFTNFMSLKKITLALHNLVFISVYQENNNISNGQYGHILLNRVPNVDGSHQFFNQSFFESNKMLIKLGD